MTKLKHLRTKQKTSQEEDANGKTDGQNMPNVPTSQNKTNRRKKKQSESAKGPIDVYLINESQQTPSNKSNKQSATTPTDELHQRTAKTKKHKTEVKK